MTTMIATLLLLALTAGATPLPRTYDALPALRDGRWHDALPVLETVVAANPFDGRARYYLGIIYQRLERDHESVDELRAALDLGVTGNRRGMRSAHLALVSSRLIPVLT